MSKRPRENDPASTTSSSGATPVSASLLYATLGGVVALAVVTLFSWNETRSVRQDIGERLARLEGQVKEISSRASAAQRPPAQNQAPDPGRVYTIKVDGAPAKGPESAPIVIAEFSDFECPFCGRVNPTMDKIQEVYGDKVRIAWKHLPLSMHKNAPLAHQASVAAHQQGKFWEYHDKLFANQRNLKQPDLVRYAQELGLDVARFEAALNDGRFKSIVDADASEAAALGVRGTPGFFVNGRFLGGAKPFEEFAKLINAELERLNLPIPPGATPAG